MPGDFKPPPHSFLYAIGSSFLTLVYERYRLRLGGLPAPLMMTESQHGFALRETKLFYESYVERRSERVRLHQAKILFARFVEQSTTRRTLAYGLGTRREPYVPARVIPPEQTLAEAVDEHNQSLSSTINMPPCLPGNDYLQSCRAWEEKILYCQHQSVRTHYYRDPKRELVLKAELKGLGIKPTKSLLKTDNATLCLDCGKVWLR